MFNYLKTALTNVTKALSKTALFFRKRLDSIFSHPLDETSKQLLEELLYEADLGSETVNYFMEKIEHFAKSNKEATKEDFLEKLEEIGLSIFETNKPILVKEQKDVNPKIIFIVGVNGSGKTTSIAKLGKIYKDQGKKVLFACGDTFRAAASEQLDLHAKALTIDIVLAKQGQDPGSVIYDALIKAKHGDYDLVICDSAGRLESRTELLEELKKIDLVVKKIDKNAPHEVYLTIDAGLGQTCLSQVENFKKFISLTGLILTKIDSTSKGGVALSIYKQQKLPIVYVGFGETLCDFSPFDARSYVKALFRG